MNRNEQIINWLRNRANKVFEDKDLILQLFGVFMIFSMLCIVLPILSGITEFTELYHEFNAANSTSGLIFAIIILLTIEGVKIASISILFIKWFSGKMSHISVFAILALCAQSASIYFSIQGSKRVPKMLHVAPVFDIPKLIDIDSIKVAHDSIIAAKEAYNASYFESNKKQDSKTGNWRLSSSLRGHYNLLKVDALTAEEQRQISIDKAEAKNEATLITARANHKETLKKFNEQISVSSSKMWYWSVIIETLFFFSSLFVFWYLSKVITDNETDKITVSTPINTKTERTTGTVNKTAIAHLGTTKKTDKKRITDNCLNCGTDIRDKRIDAKYCKAKCRTDHFKMKS